MTPSNRSRRSLYALRTHFMDDDVRAHFAKLQRDLGVDNVFIMYNDTRNPWERAQAPPGVVAQRGFRAEADPGAPVAPTVMVFSDPELLLMNPMHDKGYGHDAASWCFWHPDTSAVLMYTWLRDTRRLDFEYLWLIEFDVRCNGDFKVALDACDAIDADLMAKGGDAQFEIRQGKLDPGWCWWDSLVGEIAATPRDRQYGILMSIARLSGAMVGALRDSFGRSGGFCEVYLPTLCRSKGLVLASMPPHVFGVFRFRPVVPPELMTQLAAHGPPDHRLYHPVKDMSRNS